MSTAKASAICWAIRGQPHLGLRRFMSTMASTSAWDGPLGPVRRRVGENNQRYLRVRRARWNSRIVDGLSTIAERITRAGRMNSAHTPARIRFRRAEIRRPVPRAIQNEQLLLDQDRFSHDRPQAAGAHHQASMAGTKVLITDVGANGLLADDAGVDMVDGGSGVLRLDGGGPQMSGDEYRSAVADADQQYARMLSALIASAP